MSGGMDDGYTDGGYCKCRKLPIFSKLYGDIWICEDCKKQMDPEERKKRRIVEIDPKNVCKPC